MSFNQTNLIGLLETIAERYPDRPALKDCNRMYTYDELYRTVRQAAEILSVKGAGAGDRIVCVSRKNTESILCFWAILCCGAVPVMLDQEDGPETNALKIKTVSPQLIILDKKEQPLSSIHPDKISLEPHDLLPAGALPEYKRPIRIPDTALCYILLTSGTTGIPKAVQISHLNVLHYTAAVYERLGRPQGGAAAHVTTLAADLGLTNLCVTLAAGGLLRVFNKEESTDPAVFDDILVKDNITLLKITPSHLLSILKNRDRAGRSIENLLLGGEKLSWETVKKIFSLNICRNLYNHYGPTETTIGATVFPVTTLSGHFDKTASVPIGTPLGQGACFLDREGDTGELCIGGPGVGLGYLGNEEETHKKFFTRINDGVAQACYRTGDICKKLDDGNFEFLYRTDRQVKVHGYRIELGEVELSLTAHPDVENAIVLLSEKAGRNILEAYVKLIEGRTMDAGELRAWLRLRGPANKVPAEIHFYTHAPFTSNGKIDLVSLRETHSELMQDAAALSVTNEMAAGEDITGLNGNETERDAWEREVLISWKKALNRSTIEETDHFFETGGDSLLAIQVIGRLQRFGYKVHIRDLNQYPVYEDFIALRPGSQVKSPGVFLSSEEGRTYSQQAFLQQTATSLNTYCQSILLETDSKIRIREMAMALICVLQGHGQLTTRFLPKEESDNEGKADTGVWELGTTILDNRAPFSLQIRQTTARLLREMSISKGRLFRAHVFVDPAGKDYLYLICHHLAIDVISWNIILDELPEYYEQILQGIVPSVSHENTVPLFYSHLKDSLPESNRYFPESLPGLVRLPPAFYTFNKPVSSQVCCLKLPDDIARILSHSDEQPESFAVSDFLLGAFARAVLQELSLPEISVDVEFHGRPDHKSFPDVSRSVAWWSATLPVNFTLSDTAPGPCSLLLKQKAEQANLLNLLFHQSPGTTAGHSDIRFNYLGSFPELLGNASLRLRPSVFNPGATRDREAQLEYALSFTCRFIGASLIADIQYLTPRFSTDRIAMLATNMLQSLRQLLIDRHPSLTTCSPMLLDSNQLSVGQPLYNVQFPRSTPGTAGKHIFITGATGFLGIHLVHELVRNAGIKLCCLVRGENQARAEHRFMERLYYYFDDWKEETLQRIKIVKGDLLLDRLGMDELEYSTLKEDTDLIIHAAADVNLLKDYAQLKAINTDTLRSIFDLARSGKQKEIHYVSTLAVSGYLAGRKTIDFSESCLDLGQSFISDYEKTKFEAEMMVRNFLNEGGRGKIYRTGHMAADSLYGRFQRNAGQNRIYQLIKGMLLLGKIPAGYQEKISFSYVDVVAKALAGLSLGTIDTSMPCLHLENPQYLSFSRITAMLREMGYTIEVVDLVSFEEAIANFEGLQKDREIIHLMRTWVLRAIDFPRKINYLNSLSLDILAGSGLYFPEADFTWFSDMIRQGIDTGYFHPPSFQGARDFQETIIAATIKNEH